MENSLCAVVKKVMNPIHTVPSLHQLALVRTVATILVQDEMKDALFNFSMELWGSSKQLQFQKEEWKTIKSIVENIVPNSCLPLVLKHDLLDLLWPMTLEIVDWIQYHSTKFDIFMPQHLCWTWQGNLDKKRTAELIVKDRTLYVEKRYRLACHYCLEEEILPIWRQMNRNQRKTFSSRRKRPGIEEPELVYCMANLVLQKPQPWSIYERELSVAVKDGNVIATKFILKKISSEKKEKALQSSFIYLVGEERFQRKFSFPQKEHDEMWYIWFSEVETKYLVDRLKRLSFTLLNVLLRTRREAFFMETATQMWGCLEHESFATLLFVILRKYEEGYKSDFYKKLFIDFWEESPEDFKRFVNTESMHGAKLLVHLLNNNFPVSSDMRTYENESNHFCILLENRSRIPPFGFDAEKWTFLRTLMWQRIPTKLSLILYKERLPTTLNYVSTEKRLDRILDLADRIL